ncbi:HRDC domain-containing protein [Chryseomicrobium palamuruense]|uniref:HRDC domain-containing protein n=1 Tax=Chryseomicrobium palamuruense TaxID=682973 RepID=A0ABV8UUU6_9BACL
MLRLHLTKQTNRKAYHIFKNQTLEQLVKEKPQTLEELLKIDGIGKQKVEEFGVEVVKIIQGHTLVNMK